MRGHHSPVGFLWIAPIIKIIKLEDHKMKYGQTSAALLLEKAAAAIVRVAQLVCRLPARCWFGTWFCQRGVLKMMSQDRLPHMAEGPIPYQLVLLVKPYYKVSRLFLGDEVF